MHKRNLSSEQQATKNPSKIYQSTVGIQDGPEKSFERRVLKSSQKKIDQSALSKEIGRI